ncbi:MAG: nucleoside deaminase [bacterium]|nr:nucleoside deaminase [bacterium]
MDFTISLPEWAVEEQEKLPAFMPTLEERMAAVIHFSQLNFERGTGGPFAAGVFECDSGKRVVIGVNRVVPSNCSSAHAEVVTLSLAQKLLGTFDLGGAEMPTYQLVVNWRPCAMCYGAVLWSGIRSLAIAGSGPELERITGFDEGPIHPQWDEELRRRGVELVEHVLTNDALNVFHAFHASGALVYNGRLGK